MVVYFEGWLTTQLHQGLSRSASADSGFFVRITDYADWRIALILSIHPVCHRIAVIAPDLKGVPPMLRQTYIPIKNGNYEMSKM